MPVPRPGQATVDGTSCLGKPTGHPAKPMRFAFSVERARQLRLPLTVAPDCRAIGAAHRAVALAPVARHVHNHVGARFRFAAPQPVQPQPA